MYFSYLRGGRIKRMSVSALACGLMACVQNAYAQTADGIEDTTDFPVNYWNASYYEGRDGIAGSTSPNEANGSGGAGLKTFRGEAVFGIGSNDVTIISNGSAISNRWANNETPTSPILHTPDYVGAVWTGSNPHYQIDLRRKVANGGNLTFGFGSEEILDDVVEVFVNGTREYAYFPGGGAPDARPGAGVGATVPLNAGDEVLFRFINLGFIGGFSFRFQSPVLPAPLVANDDAVSVSSSGSVQNDVILVGANDTLGGASLPGSAVYFVAAGSSLPPQLTFDSATGGIDVVAGAAAGTYAFDYRVCETADEFNCAVATATVTVTTPISTLPKFTCPSRFYETIDGQLTRFDPLTGTYINIGSDQLFYNGAGYNILDNYAYALGKEGAIDTDLIRIGSNGAIEVIAENIASTASGDMGGDGYLYYGPQATRIKRVRVTAPFDTQTLNFTGPANTTVLDVAYLTQGGKDYFAGAKNGRVYVWNITDLVTFSFPVTGLESGSFGAAWTANDGNLYVNSNTSGNIYNIDNPLTSPSVVGTYSGSVSNRHDGLSCPLAASPFSLNGELTGSKSVTMVNSGEFAVPGNDVIYTLTVNNVGTGPVDTDSVFLVDNVPDEIEFYNGDIDGGGPQTNPVSFTGPGSGLTFNYASDVGFSNAAARPADFAACNYAPAAGYDPNVNYICFNPKGAMAAGNPDPEFSVSFRAKIK